MTGSGVVLPEDEAAEVTRTERALLAEMKPPGEAGAILVRRMAVLSVRMDRAAHREIVAMDVRARQALEEFVAPEGVDAATAEILRREAVSLARIDLSKEAILARRYEANAERGFFRSLQELRRLTKQDQAVAPIVPASPSTGELASLLQARKEFVKVAASMPRTVADLPPKIIDSRFPADFLETLGGVDVPISIGRRL